MNFFDLFRRRTVPTPSVPPSEEDAVVPDGHKVVVYQPQMLPCIERSAGGVCIACQGSTSDEPVAELERLLREVEDAIRGNRPQVVMATHACRISELFAPADPAIRPVAGAIVWVLDPAVMVGSSLGPQLFQMLLRNLYAIGTRSTPPPEQFVYVPEFESPGGRLFAELVSDLGLPVRERDPTTNEVLIEVHRPEGIILSALPGRLFSPNEGAAPYVRQINEEKNRAEEQGDTDTLRKLMEQELEELAKRLEPARVLTSKTVTRAPHLCRLLLAAHDGKVEAWRALYEELLQREIPLLLIVDPTTRGAKSRTWPGKGTAMPVYPDRASLMRAASDLAITMETLAIGEMPPRELLGWMGKQNVAVALNIYRDDKTPLYVWLNAEAVQALSEGKVPQILN